MMSQARRLRRISDMAERYPRQNLKFADNYLKRAFRKFGKRRAKVKSSIVRRYVDILGKMETIYSKTTVPNIHNSNIQYELDPDLTEIIAKNRNLTELDYYWNQWFTKVGSQIKPLYKEYVKILNSQARGQNQNNAAEMHSRQTQFFGTNLEQL